MSDGISDFLKILSTEQSTKEDLRNFIASHIEAAFSFFYDQYSDQEQKESSSDNFKKSLKNLEGNGKMESEELKTYYKRILKSQLLYYIFTSPFSEAQELLAEISTNKDSTILQDSIKHTFLEALANFLNSIGSQKFITCESNEKQIDKFLKDLDINVKDVNTQKTFQRIFTKNGFLSVHGFNEDGEAFIKKFKVKPRFDFTKFTSIYQILTGSKKKNFESMINDLLNSTDETPLMFLNRFSSDQSTIYQAVTKDLPSFISSPPHAFEKLVIDKLAICYNVDGLNEEEEEEEARENEEEEEKNQKGKDIKCYKQLLAANLRLRKPPEKSPENNYFKILDIKQSSSIPSDQCIRGTCHSPFYYNYSLDEDGDGEFITKDDQKRLQKSFYTDIVDSLQPIEFQLIRILEFSHLLKFSKSNEYKNVYKKMFDVEELPDIQTQIKISRVLVGILLYPQTSFILSKDTTDLFILSCFAELFKLLKSAKVTDSSENLSNYIVAGKVRRTFQLAMDGIIPAVSQNITKLAKWTQGKDIKENDADYEEPKADESHSFYPFSSLLFLRQFILNPSLRRKCPVIYAYLRYQSRFSLTKKIYDISMMLNRIWEIFSSKNFENIDEVTFKQLRIKDDELSQFLVEWRDAIQYIDNGPLSYEANENISLSIEEAEKVEKFEIKKNTLASKVLIRPFLPYEPSCWPGLIVLESLSQSHNEFISILQQHSKIIVHDVNDYEFSDSQALNTEHFGRYLSHAIRTEINEDGLPTFSEKVENEFIRQISLLSYYYILHPLINFSIGEEVSLNSKSITSFYEEHYIPIDLTEEQKKILHIYIKECNKTAGALLLLSKFMYTAVSENAKNIKFKSSDPMSTFIETTNIPMTPIENESYSALLLAKGKLKEDFKIGQFSKIYAFLSEPIDICRKAYSLQEAIIDNVISSCQIKSVEIDNIALTNVTDYRPYFTVIPKILGDLLREGVIPDQISESNPLTPTQLIEKWVDIDEKKRMLTDKEEDEAIEQIKQMDERGNNKLTTLISYFNDAKINYKW